MIGNLIYITSIIDEWNQKLNDLTNKYFSNPVTGFLIFIGLLVIGYIAISSFAKK